MLAQQIAELDKAIADFTISPRNLVADMVLAGYAADVRENGLVALAALESDLPHRAYPNIRTAVESAQLALILATEAEYADTGAQAWCFYARKDRDWIAAARPPAAGVQSAEDADALYRRQLDGLAATWNALSPGRGDLLYAADARLEAKAKRGRPGGDWTGQNVGRLAAERFRQLAELWDRPIDDGLAEVNRDLYGILSRATHGRPRLDSYVLALEPDGRIALSFRREPREYVERSLALGFKNAAAELMMALVFRSTAPDV